MTFQWVDCDRDFISRRYDRLANSIVLFEWFLFVPAGFRRRAVEALDLTPGSRVLEIGCGTGRNFQYLRDAVGPTGHVFGVDLSPAVLARASDLIERQGWTNFTLVQRDAADFSAPAPFDAVMFGLSYNTMPHHLRVLQNALAQLRPGGRVVIMDAKVPDGRIGKLMMPLAIWLMKKTLLGNPLIRPWEHLAGMTDRFEMEQFLLTSYYVCRGVKPHFARMLQAAE